jgi:ubiquinone biosynthesis protein
MSCRKDIIPGYIIEVLEKLQDNVPPFSETKEVIENMIECEMRIAGIRDKLYDIFDTIDEKPIAAASIAQVHRARLKNGIEVAIKLQRPNLYQELFGYIELIRVLERQPLKVRFIQDLLILLKESVQNIKRELDFFEESENMILMQQVFEAYDSIVVPRVFQRYCSKKMLVMEYVGGKSIKTIQNPELANQLMSAIINGTLKYNVFHSDPHPGNISITDDNKLVIYDYGLVSRLDENVNRTENKLALFAAYNSDVDAVIRYVIKSKIIHLKRGDVQSIEELTNGEYIILYKIISYFLDYIKEIDINNIGSKIISDDVLKSTAQDSPFYLDSVALLLIRTFSTLEGTCKTMHPDFNYNEVLKPLLPTFSSDMNFFVQQVEKNIMQLGDVQTNMRKTMSNQRMHDARILKISEEVDAVKNTVVYTIITIILMSIAKFF